MPKKKKVYRSSFTVKPTELSLLKRKIKKETDAVRKEIWRVRSNTDDHHRLYGAQQALLWLFNSTILEPSKAFKSAPREQ